MSADPQGMTPLFRPGHRTRLAGILTAACLAAAAEAPAAEPGGAGSLLVAPTRLVFEGRTRTGELTLANKGTGAATYRIRIAFYAMSEDGDMREIPAPSVEDRAADGLIRYSPRQVTLEPGTSQVVRVALRKPADLPAGEYRSHLVFSPVSQAAAGNAPDDELAFKVQLNVGVAISVIVRQGETAATVALDAPVLRPGKDGAPPLLDVTIRRSGDRSLYGKLVATFQPTGGRPVEVGLTKGIGVYVPNALRRFQLSLRPPAGVSLAAGRLQVRFVDEEKGDRVLAAAELILP